MHSKHNKHNTHSGNATGYFITGVGTGIGKTFITAALCRAHQKNNALELPVCRAIKPVLSGWDPDQIEVSDTAQLYHAMYPEAVFDPALFDQITPATFRFAAPQSPHIAAALEQKPAIDINALCDWVRCEQQKSEAKKEILLVEGVGGVMAPLSFEHTVLDWIERQQLPAILVTSHYLGALSHTLTAMEVLQSRQIEVAAIMVNACEESSVSMKDTVDYFRHCFGSIAVVSVAKGERSLSLFQLLQKTR